MKTITQYLSLLLCFELIMGPVQGSLFIADANAQEKECPAGQSYVEDVNRCLTKNEVLKVNNAVQSCGEDRECYRRNAQNALKDSGDSGKNDALFKDDGSGERTGLAYAASSAAMGIPLLIATNSLLTRWRISDKEKRKAYKCNPASLLLMYAGAASLGAGEIVGAITHASKLDDIKKKWDESVVPKETSGTDKKRAEATEAQSQAFEFLAQNEDTVKETTRLKRGFYLAATGLFAAGLAAAIVEQVKLTKAEADVRVKGPEEYFQGKAKLTNPETAAAGTIQMAKAEKLIRDGKDTINKLTCSTDLKETSADSNQALDDASANKKSEEEAAKASAEKQASEERLLKEAPDSKEAIELRNKRESDAVENYNKNHPDASAPAPTPTDKKPELGLRNGYKGKNDPSTKLELDPGIYKNPAACVKNGFSWIGNPTQGFCTKRTGSLETNDKVKSVAIHNLATATDAEQLMQLVNEMNSIEFENYSRVTYLEESDAVIMKKINFTEILQNSFFPEAQAADILGSLGGVGGLAAIIPMLPKIGGILKGVKSNNGKPVSAWDLQNDMNNINGQIQKQIGKPVTRIALNTLLGGWIGFMSIHMTKQANISEKRAEKLRSMKEDFVSANGLMYCTEADRADATKPKCYCYTPENKVNPARAKTQICSMALATLNLDKNKAGVNNPKVCVTQGMAVDAACSCKNTKGADGKNTCLKATAGFTSLGFNPSTFKMISAAAAPANDLFSGTTSGADISESAGINAARIKEASDSMLAKVDPKAAKESKEIAAALEKSLMSTAGGYSLGNSKASALPSSPQAAAAALDKELKENVESAKSAEAAGSAGFADLSGTSEEMPEFNAGEKGGASEEIEIAEVMGKEVDFGSNDITKTKDTNLFDLLSNRYKRSGIKRLFEDGKPADAPSKNEISE